MSNIPCVIPQKNACDNHDTNIKTKKKEKNDIYPSQGVFNQ